MEEVWKQLEELQQWQGNDPQEQLDVLQEHLKHIEAQMDVYYDEQEDIRAMHRYYRRVPLEGMDLRCL